MCVAGLVETIDGSRFICDDRTSDGRYEPRRGPIAYLPHNLVGVMMYGSHCNWVIGGPEQVRQLISDLQAVLEKWERNG